MKNNFLGSAIFSIHIVSQAILTLIIINQKFTYFMRGNSMSPTQSSQA